jgi:hypothetical protein
MQNAIQYRNNTINRITQLIPIEMKIYPQLEETWIRSVRENNNMTKKLQVESDLFNFQIGDILLICFDKNITKNNFNINSIFDIL